MYASGERVCMGNYAWTFLRLRLSCGLTWIARCRRVFTTSLFFAVNTESISASLPSVSLSNAACVVDVVPAC